MDENNREPFNFQAYLEYAEATREDDLQLAGELVEFNAEMCQNGDDQDARYGAAILIRECAEVVHETMTDEEIDAGARAIMSLYHLPRNVRRQMLTRAREIILLDPQNWEDSRE